MDGADEEEDEQLLLLRNEALKTAGLKNLELLESSASNENNVKTIEKKLSVPEKNSTKIALHLQRQSTVKPTNNSLPQLQSITRISKKNESIKKQCHITAPEKDLSINLKTIQLNIADTTPKQLLVKGDDIIIQNLSIVTEHNSTILQTSKQTLSSGKALRPTDEHITSKADNNESAELILRQEALKTLLKKRVAKTGELMKQKAAVAHEKAVTHQTKPVRLIRKQPAVVAAVDKVTRDYNVGTKSPEQYDPFYVFTKKVSVGSGDEISICASDEDEASSDSIGNNGKKKLGEKGNGDKEVQCNVVSCSDSKISSCHGEETSVKGTPGDSEQKEGNNKTIDCVVDEECSPLDPLSAPSDQCENLFKHTGISISFDSQNKELWKSFDDLSQNNSESANADKPFLVELAKFKADLRDGITLARSNMHKDKAGPSRHQKSETVYDSDSSVEVVSPPSKPPPCLIALSDSDNDEVGKGKQKKKKTLKDILNEQVKLSGKTEDLKDQSCSVCLGPFENRAFLDLYSFCYICIVQWSELSRLCPLCKSKYNALIHSVTQDLEYERFVFTDNGSKTASRTQRREFSEQMEDGRRFRYRSTVVDTETWNARRAAREETERERTKTREQRKISRRLKWSATKDRRKAVYKMHMEIQDVKQRGTKKYRDISPKFFQDNPAMKHRLVPWLLRDLNVLLGDDDDNIRFVMSMILNMMSKISLKGEEFLKQLEPFLFDKTHHFVKELISFAQSPYDIRGYDDNVVYRIPVLSPSHQLSNTLNEQITVEDHDPFREKLLHEVFLANDENDSMGRSKETSPMKNEESLHLTVESDSSEITEDNSERLISLVLSPSLIEMAVTVSPGKQKDQLQTQNPLESNRFSDRSDKSENALDRTDAYKHASNTSDESNHHSDIVIEKTTKHRKKMKKKHRRRHEKHDSNELEIGTSELKIEETKRFKKKRKRSRHATYNESAELPHEHARKKSRHTKDNESAELPHEHARKKSRHTKDDESTELPHEHARKKSRRTKDDESIEVPHEHSRKKSRHTKDDESIEVSHEHARKKKRKHRKHKKRKEKETENVRDGSLKVLQMSRETHSSSSEENSETPKEIEIKEEIQKLKTRISRTRARRDSSGNDDASNEKKLYDDVPKENEHGSLQGFILRNNINETEISVADDDSSCSTHGKRSRSSPGDIKLEHDTNKEQTMEQDRKRSRSVSPRATRKGGRRNSFFTEISKTRKGSQSPLERTLDIKSVKKNSRTKEQNEKSRRKVSSSEIDQREERHRTKSKAHVNYVDEKNTLVSGRSMLIENSFPETEISGGNMEVEQNRSPSGNGKKRRERSLSGEKAKRKCKKARMNSNDRETHETKHRHRTQRSQSDENSKGERRKNRLDRRKHKKSKSKKKKKRKRIESTSDSVTSEDAECLRVHSRAPSALQTSDAEDELTVKRLKEYLKNFTTNKKLDLIKDGDSFKTRAEVVEELFLIEKTLTEKRNERERSQLNAPTQAVADSTVLCPDSNASSSAIDPSKHELKSKEQKRLNREKSYRQLIKELQDIEGRINNCRGSLQSEILK